MAFTTGRSEERIAPTAAVTPGGGSAAVHLADLVAHLASPASGRGDRQVIGTVGTIGTNGGTA